MKNMGDKLDKLYESLQEARRDLVGFLNSLKLRCPNCGYRQFEHGTEAFYICKRCGCVFHETEGLKIAA